MLSGVNKLCMMKSDILSYFDSIKVCTHYIYKGEKIDYFPYDVVDVEVEPVYEELKGWNTDLTEVRAESEFPKELSEYISYLEKALEVPITIVSVGPDRNQTIIRSA